MDTRGEIVLYSYWRSSASYRVRLALALKGLAYTIEPIHLVEDGGQQYQATYLQLNPQALVPTLIHNDLVLNQSLAIIEYLDETFPTPPLLPGDSRDRAKIRALSQLIACDIAPLANLRVLNYIAGLQSEVSNTPEAWAKHWIETGLGAVETHLSANHPEPKTARYCFGDKPTMADCCLLPQVYNAVRFGCDLSDMPTVRAICSNFGHNELIKAAKPENQPDAPKND
jgi:maleylacetoacetate isomerase